MKHHCKKPTTEPRIWGKWQTAFYPSGTTIVHTSDFLRKPHLYIYADAAIDEDRYMRDRYEMCRQIEVFMNGGERPEWLNDFERVGETCARSLAGGDISAVGPSIDRNPPNLDWVHDDSQQAKDDRARLMDVLFNRYLML